MFKNCWANSTHLIRYTSCYLSACLHSYVTAASNKLVNPEHLPTNCDIYILKILWHNNYEEGVSVHWVCLVKQIKCDEENVATDCISQHEPPDNTSVMDYIPCQLLGIPVHILLTITFTLYLSDHFILTCTQLSLSLSIFLITSSWHAHNYHFHSVSFWSLHLDMHTIITFTIFPITSSWHAHNFFLSYQTSVL